MTFQHIIETLNSFWSKQGCIIGQPYGVVVGAGTGNPHTFFRVLGPEPYNVAYVEPSRRPNDGRYGESPNRFQHYFQYQVILKPAPKFNQELYLESLIALGLDPKKHDIRFVEDNWESTPLGAWGLGWEVWCDGMEVSQYTYFQQMAGTTLEVPAVEITYGLERLAMYIQDVDTYKDLKWNDTTTYADIFQRHEYWQSTHNFETSTPETLQLLYKTYDEEIQRQLERKNFWSAYDYQLNLSHIFNLLEARGMVSLSDRVAKFNAMSRYTREISKQYLEDRKALGYPLLKRMKPMTYKPPVVSVSPIKRAGYQKNVAVVELGFEEIPSEYLEQWSTIITHSWFKKQLSEAGIAFRKAYVYLTPRRIILKVVQPSKKGRVEQLQKGPAWNLLYDANGKITPVLEGFLKKYHATEKQIKKEMVSGKEIVTINQVIEKELNEVLQNIVIALIDTAPKTRWMVWQQDLPAFIRPLRWIIAYHNNKQLDIKVMDVTSDKLTQLPRYERPAQARISSAQQYLDFLRTYKLIVSAKKRARRIKTEALPKKDNRTQTGKFDTMVTKNTFLTENPHAATVALESRYKELPQELITLILEKNQMYPISKDTLGGIWYSIIANQYRVHKRIILGNQKVAKARLEDGLFYFNQDRQKTLKEIGEGLQFVSFHPKAGNYIDKKLRIRTLVENFYTQLGREVPEKMMQALELIKNDKASSLGREFPSLEGKIGRDYALREGIDTEIADLLADHYLPTDPDGALPPNIDALILSLADKVDSVNTFATVEKLPEGGSDPYEIRKTVYRILAIVTKSELSFDIPWATPELKAYVQRRFQQMLEDEGFPYWIASGVANASGTDFGAKYRYAVALKQKTLSEEATTKILDTFKRVVNILTKNTITVAMVDNPSEFIHNMLSKENLETEERNLAVFLKEHVAAGIHPEEIALLAEKLETFFENVMVMAEDEVVRDRRVGMLQVLRSVIEKDFSIDFQ